MKGDECTTDACMRVSNRSANLYFREGDVADELPLLGNDVREVGLSLVRAQVVSVKRT
jgi:hypothetical protein